VPPPFACPLAGNRRESRTKLVINIQLQNKMLKKSFEKRLIIMYRFLFDSFMRFCKQKGTLAGITRTLYSLLRIYFNTEITDSRHFSLFLQENWENIWSIQQKHLPLQRKKPRWRNR
jgi:hypothetical protein